MIDRRFAKYIHNSFLLVSETPNMVKDHENSDSIWYESVLKTGTCNSLTTRDLMCWSFQIARGMDYLASKNVNFFPYSLNRAEY